MISPEIATATVTRNVIGAPLLRIRKVAKHFGKNVVLRDISLEVAEGEFLTILGESGSGKTTLLRIIAGFERATLVKYGWVKKDWIWNHLTGAA